jgi:glycine/D-amino acid oxidase-like deaminating enzyme
MSDRTYEVIIIGAGIMGAALALELTRSRQQGAAARQRDGLLRLQLAQRRRGPQPVRQGRQN